MKAVIPEEACINCHFFVREGIKEDWVTSVIPETRSLICNSDESEMSGASTDFSSFFRCYFGVWSQVKIWERTELADASQIARPKNVDKEYLGELQKAIVQHDRRGECFFLKYNPDMSIQAAELIRQRQELEREADENRRNNAANLQIANRNLKIAIAALVLSIIVQLCTALTQISAINQTLSGWLRYFRITY